MNFEFDAKRDSRVASFKLVAESNNYQSEFIDITSTKVDVITKLVTISDISVNDIEGNRLSDVSVGFTVDIQSGIWIEYSGEQEAEEQPYVYYIQIKQSGEKAFVEFIGKDFFEHLGHASMEFPPLAFQERAIGYIAEHQVAEDVNQLG